MIHKELCNCEGCFKTADSLYKMMDVEFVVCKDHNPVKEKEYDEHTTEN